MPPLTQNIEWLSHNANRRYPLADDAEAVDASGGFRLPDSFLVEVDLPVHAGLNTGPAGFFVKAVSAFAGGYGITIGYQPDAGDAVTVASALIPRQGFARNSVFTVGGIGAFADTVGKVVIGRLDDIDAQPPGVWEFTLSSTRLDPDAVRPIIRGVSSITCVNGGQRSERLYGDIELTAGSNMRIVPVVGETTTTIRFDAVSGAGTVDTCVCEGDDPDASPVYRINGVAPTTAGDFNIIGSDCVQIVPVANGLRIVDTCAQPCCGCEELERITQDLERLLAQAKSVEDFVDRLGTAVDTMSLTVLGSKIGDRNCIQCG